MKYTILKMIVSYNESAIRRHGNEGGVILGNTQTATYCHCQLETAFPVFVLINSMWPSEKVTNGRQHFHNCVEIGMMKAGTALLLVNDQQYEIAAPCIVYIPPYTPHQFQYKENCTVAWDQIYTEPSQLFRNRISHSRIPETKVAWYVFRPETCILSLPEYARYHDIFCSIIDELQERFSQYQAMVQIRLEEFFLLMSRRIISIELFSTTVPDLGVMGSVNEYIGAHYQEDISDQTLSELVHFSESYFRRLFKETFNTTPKKYINFVRAHNARDLLLDTKLSLYSIAMKVGFPSVKVFSTVFRKLFFITPYQYRLAYSKKHEYTQSYIVSYTTLETAQHLYFSRHLYAGNPK